MFDIFWRAIGHSSLPFAESLLWRSGVLSANRSDDFTIPWRGIVYHGNMAYWIDRHIYFLGAYAPAELQFLEKGAAVARRRGEPTTMLDIGANVGQHSLAMHRHVDRILAFEPSSEVAARLKTNVHSNGISNIEVHEVALGDRDESGQLGSGLPGNDGSRSLHWTLDEAESVEVSVRHAGEYLANLERSVPRIDLIKLDVEGSEKAVFSALKQDMHRDRPVIIFEMVGSEVRGGFSSKEELHDLLYENHILFGFKGWRSPQLHPFVWSECEQAVCLPSERIDDFRSMIT